MKERPIIFSAPMVNAILEGRKTMTRRVVKPQPDHPQFGKRHMLATDDEGVDLYLHSSTLHRAIRCPYGTPGDRLWVRESGWERPERTAKMMREGADTWPRFAYVADGWSEDDHADFKRWGFKRRPSIHMPRWASRILLEITSVRVERLNDITVADAVAEGALVQREVDQFARVHAISMFSAIWQGIHGPGSWAANPWVWVVEFQRVFS